MDTNNTYTHVHYGNSVSIDTTTTSDGSDNLIISKAPEIAAQYSKVLSESLQRIWDGDGVSEFSIEEPKTIWR